MLFKVRIIIFLRYVLFKMRIIRVSIIPYINCVEDEPESASATLLSQASFRRQRKGYSFLGALESCLISGAISCLPDATERAAATSLPPRDRGLPRLTSNPVTWAAKTRSRSSLIYCFLSNLCWIFEWPRVRLFFDWYKKKGKGEGTDQQMAAGLVAAKWLKLKLV